MKNIFNKNKACFLLSVTKKNLDSYGITWKSNKLLKFLMIRLKTFFLMNLIAASGDFK